jgi:NifU-like protein involved in Fe-S cluster formation
MEFFGDFRALSEKRDYEGTELASEALLTNPVCGDEVRMLVETLDDRIISFAFQARGCWPVYGCLQWLGEKFVGSNVSEALGFKLEEFLDFVQGVPASKRHAFSLTHRAFRRAVTQALMRSDPERVGSVGPPGKERV